MSRIVVAVLMLAALVAGGASAAAQMPPPNIRPTPPPPDVGRPRAPSPAPSGIIGVTSRPLANLPSTSTR